MHFDEYVRVRGEVANVLGLLYENSFFRRIRWWTSIGKHDFALLGNLIRRKFGRNPLLTLGDKSAQTAVRFHAPTQGVGLRYQLHCLGFHVLLLDEYRTSSTCPDCFGNTKQPSIKQINLCPWRRQFGEVSIHGLLECESEQCKTDCGGQSKKWNRDLLAVCKSV